VPPRPISQGLLTRREVVEYLRANDYPLSLSTMNRLCAPAQASGAVKHSTPPPKRSSGRATVSAETSCGVGAMTTDK
jgi:hypothetical protein